MLGKYGRGGINLKNIAYQDTGCHLEPKCLTCPRSIEECTAWKEQRGQGRPKMTQETRKAIMAILEEGKTVEAIAGEFNVSLKSIRRIKAEARGKEEG